MDSDFTEESLAEDEEYKTSKLTKKRKKTGRVRDVMKRLRLASHETGEDCLCKRFECFLKVSHSERTRIISEFNRMISRDEQNSYLAGLITVLPIAHRRPRKDNSGLMNQATYSYRVSVNNLQNNLYEDIPVCFKAFLSIHGITESRVRYIKSSLTKTGASPKDKRGKHSNRPKKTTEETRSAIINFIKSLKGRKSHYSTSDTDKLYLPEDLNIAKLAKMCKIETKLCFSYDTFREIFNNSFNIGFGFPRKDTCSACDLFEAQKSVLKESIKNASSDIIEGKNLELSELETNHFLHTKKAEKFYSLKRLYKKKSRNHDSIEAIAMDFEKNLPTPNITTNDVYYKRQLSFYSFNIHKLATNDVYFYTYDETVARKGADDVCSMLDHFITNFLDQRVREFVIFCDSCAGQNKNYTVIRYLHYMVSVKKRFDCAKVVFPERGHSYLECDRDMGLINQKSYVETPSDWREVIENSRKKPSPYNVIDCKTELFKSWTDFLKPTYIMKCPFQTRQIRCLKFESNTVKYRNSFFGSYITSDIMWRPPKKGKKKRTTQPLKNSYDGPLSVSLKKFNDLQHLKKFLKSPEAQKFYERIPTGNQEENYEDVYVDYPGE